MYLLREKEIWEHELNLLTETYEILDDKLEELCEQSVSCDDTDSCSYYDRIEYLLGFGLIALQTFITETGSHAGLRKHQTFLFGPMTQSGTSKIQILNAIGNYWKHREEWVFEGGQKRKDAVNKLFEEVGYSTDIDYPISGVLTELLFPSEVRFVSLLELIIEWRNELIKHTLDEQSSSDDINNFSILE